MTQDHYVQIGPSSLHGTISIPPSKSHTMRALLLSAMGYGKSTLKNLLNSPDVEAMIRAVTLLGATIECTEKTERGSFTAFSSGIGMRGGGIDLNKGNLFEGSILNVGNSGQVLRFITPFFAMQKRAITITGDDSICSLRPILPLIEALSQIGGICTYKAKRGFAPYEISGTLTAGSLIVDGSDSQTVSALLLSLPFLQRTAFSSIQVLSMSEKPWVEFTLWWLRKVGIEYQYDEATSLFSVPGGAVVHPFSYTIPPDMSSLAFPLVLAAITDSDLSIPIELSDDPQGDVRVISILQEMGADISYSEQQQLLRIKGKKRGSLKPVSIDMDSSIDLLPALAVAAAFADGTTKLYNAASARHKESDRISESAKMLLEVNIKVEEREDGLIIYGNNNGPNLTKNSHFSPSNDHRMAMSQIILSAAIRQRSSFITVVGPVDSISKSFPSFFELMGLVGLSYVNLS